MKHIVFTILIASFCVGCDAKAMVPPESTPIENATPVTEGRYGVRWQRANPHDLGERCLDAVGLQATFGVGSTEGHSDFDSIYPWSEIRRCNVRMVGDTPVITYDDEPGFALDGSNGDVMVRIPKFYVEKYVEDGYEYRVVSGKGDRPHPAFIEDGKELDDIYIAAFEGYMGSDSLLRSVADVIPTSNITAQQFLNAAQQRGPQYTLYDMRCVDMLFSLIAVEFGCRNTGTIFGYGIADYRQPIEKEWDTELRYYSRKNEQQTNTITCGQQYWKRLILEGTNICICEGNQRNILTFARCTAITVNGDQTTYTFDGPPIDITTDCFIGSCAQSTNWTETCSVPYRGATGRGDMDDGRADPRERNPMRYRWMENLVGNVWHFLPDVMFTDCQMYVCSNMRDYVFSYNHTSAYLPYGDKFTPNRELGTLDDTRGTNCWVTTLMPDTEQRGISMGDAFDNTLTSGEAFGAYYYVFEDHGHCVNGGGFDHRIRCNLLTTRGWVYDRTRWHLYGARLLFKDVLHDSGVTNSKALTTTMQVQLHEGTLTVSGLADGTSVAVYDATGRLLAEGAAHASTVTLATNLQPGQVAIVKAGGQSVKVVSFGDF